MPRSGTEFRNRKAKPYQCLGFVLESFWRIKLIPEPMARVILFSAR
jgi:hypothetical protein